MRFNWFYALDWVQKVAKGGKSFHGVISETNSGTPDFFWLNNIAIGCTIWEKNLNNLVWVLQNLLKGSQPP